MTLPPPFEKGFFVCLWQTFLPQTGLGRNECWGGRVTEVVG